MNRRITKEHVSTIIDSSSGEVTEEVTRQSFNVAQEPPFVKLYIDDIARLYDIRNTGKELLLELLRRMDYDGLVTLSPVLRKKICRVIGVKAQTITDQLRALKKSELIMEEGHNTFLLNPHLFARGSWSAISNMRDNFVKLTLTYADDSSYIEAEVSPS